MSSLSQEEAASEPTPESIVANIVSADGELGEAIEEEACTLCDAAEEIPTIVDVVAESADPVIIETTIEAFDEIEQIIEEEDNDPEVEVPVDVVPLIMEIEEAEGVLGK